MKLILLALVAFSAYGAAVATDVTAADFGTAVFTNGTTLALATCTSTVTLTIVTGSTVGWGSAIDFVWSASASVTAALDTGFYCNPVTTSTTAPIYSIAYPCVIATYSAAFTRTAGTTLTTSIPSTASQTSVVFTLTQFSTTFPIFWNTTLSSGKSMKLYQAVSIV